METQKDEEHRKAILEAARRVFQKWGLNKTTMEDIAHEAGKGKSTLYYYFESKEQIFETLVISEFSNILQSAMAAIATVESGKDKLKKFTSTTLSEIKKTVSVYPVITGELRQNKEFINKLRARLDSMEEAIILEILEYGLKRGEFNYLTKKNVGKAASVLCGIIRGMAMYLFLEIDDKETMDIATKMITEGL